MNDSERETRLGETYRKFWYCDCSEATLAIFLSLEPDILPPLVKLFDDGQFERKKIGRALNSMVSNPNVANRAGSVVGLKKEVVENQLIVSELRSKEITLVGKE